MDSQENYQQWVHYLHQLYQSQIYMNQYYAQTLHKQYPNTKIHFNPKFINATVNVPQRYVPTQITPPRSAPCSTTNVISQTISHKSKYSLVRNKNSTPIQTPKIQQTTTLNRLSTCIPIKTSIRINKYKCVNISSLRAAIKKPEPVKEPRKNAISITKSKYKIEKKIMKTSPTTTVRIKNKYKYVRNQASTINNSKTKPAKKPTISYKSKYTFSRIRTASLNRSVPSTSFKRKAPIPIKGKHKLNNLPCPLFRKFGKCIRNKCEYQHDKKHVSICRKFIKGLCHDKTCLLSHELSSNKLPTCYFYLNGICTKDNCPYLHVKLNDNTTICKNFLKGYCEKGEDCLQRHVSEMRKKPKIGAKNSNSLLKIKQKTKKMENKKSRSSKSIIIDAGNAAEEATSSRYYEKPSDNSKNNEEVDDVIKPTRCKLGALPSFIKF